VIVEISRCADKVDGGMQLLIAQPALMFFSPLEPSSGGHAHESHQGTDHASQEVAHRYKIAADSARERNSTANSTEESR
jgi:hypothetical protein